MAIYETQYALDVDRGNTWSISEVDQDQVDSFCDQFSLKRPIIKSLLLKGIDADAAEDFLRPSLDLLSNPFRLPDMKKAVDRIWLARENNEKVIIHGDYDTDGVTSAVLLEWVLLAYGVKAEVFVSNRMEDGYGPTGSTVEKAKLRGASLIISTDCGITSFEACEKATELGMQIIVTDHHNPGVDLPAAYAIVNPRLSPELIDLHGLAGVGVAFKVCHAFIKSSYSKDFAQPDIDLRYGLDLVALGTVADVSPMTGENRCLIKNGMKLLEVRQRPAVEALCEISYVEGRVTGNDISRRLAPKINAAGRVGDPMVSVELFKSKDKQSALKSAYVLDRFNKQRRKAERSAFDEAIEAARFELGRDNRGGLVVSGDGWHPGIIGLLATKVSKHFSRPTIILCYDETSGELLGSGRSCAQLDILSVLAANSHLLGSFGGHPMAVGVSLRKENLAEFRDIFVGAFCNVDMESASRSEENLFADDEMMFCEVDDSLMDELEALEPFGNGNKEPIYFFRKSRVCQIYALGESHCRGVLEDDSGIRVPFICYSISEKLFPRGDLSLMASPRRVSVKGVVEVQLFIVDVKAYE